MISRDQITNLLETAVYAPSGDNSQPWYFQVQGDNLFIFCQPEKDNPKFNYHHRGTFIAHGALIENINILAPTIGFKAKIEIFPQGLKSNCTAKISFEQSAIETSPLAGLIKKRSTNRKIYQDTPLAETVKQDLERTPEEFGIGRINFISDPEQKKTIGSAVSINEIVMLEDRELHDLFFNDVRWTSEEEKQHQTGLYLKTMELEKPKELTFKILKSWKAAQFLNRLGMSKFIAKENAKGYSSGAVIGTIIVPDQDENFLIAGRILQKLWLKVLAAGCYLHTITGAVYMGQQITGDGQNKFSQKHTETIKKAYQTLNSIFGVKNGEVIAMLFRIGFSDPPSGSSSKISPQITFLDNV